MAGTKIEWAEKSWNPIRAENIDDGTVGWFCEKVAPECKNCYAEAMNRWRGNGLRYAADQRPKARLYLDEQVLEAPLHWSKAADIFVCSMTDLFGEFIEDAWIEQVIIAAEVAHALKGHTLIFLTKRPYRMLRFFRENGVGKGIAKQGLPPAFRFGVSAGNQEQADKLIPPLLELPIPGITRWLSAEPLLGPIDLSPLDAKKPSLIYKQCPTCEGSMSVPVAGGGMPCPTCIDHQGTVPVLDWVVCGGESGRNARPMEETWARSLREQCKASHVPFFMKQGSSANWKDFKNFDSFPADLQVRQYPEVCTSYAH